MARFKLNPQRPKKGRTDWSLIDELDDEAIEAAAVKDEDARPLTHEELAKMRPAPDIRRVLQELEMTPEAFANTIGIPLATIEMWNQRRKLPTAIERAFLLMIESNPELIEAADWRNLGKEVKSISDVVRKTYHVVPQQGEWVIKKSGAVRATSIHKTQKSALEAAKLRIVKDGFDLVIHGRDGRIRRRLSYKVSHADVA